MRDNDILKDKLSEIDLSIKDMNLKLAGKTYENNQLREEIKQLNSLGSSTMKEKKIFQQDFDQIDSFNPINDLSGPQY